MAFDKFRKCPMDKGLMENFYNLGLDYERKRQFNKAEAVFRYMAEHDLGFRDLPQRIARAKQMSETVMLAGARGQTAAGTLILGDAQLEKPMLGRYQIEKELGKGAMGVVYQGRDPKINRIVAIKTMALAQEFEGDELEDVKQRFFREAETAGRLNHPNIVTMYDAGEDQELAYIAMEFLKGRDLLPYCKADKLLPLPLVLSIVARVADALDYAHAQSVVHRDIKPANIMYEPDSDQVKVTDFGIARITDSSRTKTGMVLGTPSYMSPEQLAGKKIDGRSDLFSLGVTLYQLCCGRLPFSGESLAQLMFKIANEPPQDIRNLAPDLAPAVVAVIERALSKGITQRYQRGSEMAVALRACLKAGE
jgi:serine/threonine-protein kinase